MPSTYNPADPPPPYLPPEPADPLDCNPTVPCLKVGVLDLPSKRGLRITKVTQHAELSGIYNITYQVPSLDKAGQITGYKAKKFQKTVYDPRFFPDSYVLEIGQNAASKGYKRAMKDGLRQYSLEIEGVSFRIYLDNGVVTNFHPEIVP